MDLDSCLASILDAKLWRTCLRRSKHSSGSFTCFRLGGGLKNTCKSRSIFYVLHYNYENGFLSLFVFFLFFVFLFFFLFFLFWFFVILFLFFFFFFFFLFLYFFTFCFIFFIFFLFSHSSLHSSSHCLVFFLVLFLFYYMYYCFLLCNFFLFIFNSNFYITNNYDCYYHC